MQRRKFLGVVIRHDHIQGVEPIHLVCQQIGPFMVSIIGKHKTRWDFRIGQFLCSDVTVDNELQGLGCLAPRRSTHVEYRVVCLDVAQHRWHHANKLLPGYYARVLSFVNKLVDPFEPLILSEQLLRQHHFEDQILRIECLAIHLQLTNVYHLSPQLLLVHVILLAHLYGLIILDFFFGILLVLGCSGLDRVPLDELGVFEHVDYSFVAHEDGVYSKSNRKLLEQSVFKQLKLLVSGDDIGKLPAIVLIEFGTAHDIGLELVFGFLVAEWLSIFQSPLAILVPLDPLPLFVSFFLPHISAIGATIEFFLVSLAQTWLSFSCRIDVL